MNHTPIPSSKGKAVNSHHVAMVHALSRCIAALTALGAPNCEAVKEARRALALADQT